MTSPRALWRDPHFARLWAAQAVSSFGARITREGLPMTAILVLGAPPSILGVLAALSYGPAVVVGLVGGGFVDRRRKRPVLIGADLVRALVLASLPLAAGLNLLTLPQVLIAAGLVGAASVLFDIADHAYLPALVGPERLLEGNARLAATESVAELGGPALAGFLFQWLSAPVAIAVNAATYLVSALFLSGIRKAEPAQAAAEPAADETLHGGADLMQGFRAAWAEPRVRPLLMFAASNGLFGGVFSALYLLFCLRTVGLTPAYMGLAIACGGAGALIGSSLAQPVARRLGAGPAIVAAGFGAVGALVLTAMAPARPLAGLATIMLSQVLGDLTGVIVEILAASLRQAALPQAVLGRTAGAFQAARGGAMLIGALAGGLLGGLVGVREMMWVAALGFAVGPLLAAASPSLRAVRTIEVASA